MVSLASPSEQEKESKDDDDDDFDLFGSDDEETKAASEKLKQERLEMYAAKKSKSESPPGVSDCWYAACKH